MKISEYKEIIEAEKSVGFYGLLAPTNNYIIIKELIAALDLEDDFDIEFKEGNNRSNIIMLGTEFNINFITGKWLLLWRFEEYPVLLKGRYKSEKIHQIFYSYIWENLNKYYKRDEYAEFSLEQKNKIKNLIMAGSLVAAAKVISDLHN